MISIIYMGAKFILFNYPPAFYIFNIQILDNSNIQILIALYINI
jgi:hypothetical protein